MIKSDASIRTSYIGSVELISAGLSSVIQFGDTASIKAKSTGLAVQRQLDNRAGGDVEFSSYSLFSKPFNIIEEEDADAAHIQTTTVNPDPCIHVGSVKIIAYSSASIFLAGNAMETTLESRLKHFRQYAYALATSDIPNGQVSQTIQSTVQSQPQ